MSATPQKSEGSRLRALVTWIDARVPLTHIIEKHATEYYAPKNFNFWYYFGALASVVLILQLVTGLFLTMNSRGSCSPLPPASSRSAISACSRQRPATRMPHASSRSFTSRSFC